MTEVWYAAYGSNLDRDRFLTYLGGGRPPGATRTYPGARDRRPPANDRPLLLPGALFFAWESPTWGGGIAFYDAAVRRRSMPGPIGSPESSSPTWPPRRCAGSRAPTSI